jgi:hypothetical protein
MGTHNLNNQPIVANITFSYEILPVPPALTVVDVDTGKVTPGKSFEMTITVMNTGGSEATNITALLTINHALLAVEGSPDEGVDDLDAGDTDTITYTVKAHKDIDQGGQYGGTVFFTYTDSQGNLIQYNAAPASTVTVRAQEDNERSTFSLAGSVLWVGIFLFIALIIVGVLLFLGIKSLAPKPVADEKSSIPPAKDRDKPAPPPPKAEAVDEKEEKTIPEPEEEPDLEPPEGLQEF